VLLNTCSSNQCGIHVHIESLFRWAPPNTNSADKWRNNFYLTFSYPFPTFLLTNLPIQDYSFGISHTLVLSTSQCRCHCVIHPIDDDDEPKTFSMFKKSNSQRRGRAQRKSGNPPKSKIAPSTLTNLVLGGRKPSSVAEVPDRKQPRLSQLILAGSKINKQELNRKIDFFIEKSSATLVKQTITR
jgi:hypothetical protein